MGPLLGSLLEVPSLRDDVPLRAGNFRNIPYTRELTFAWFHQDRTTTLAAHASRSFYSWAGAVREFEANVST